MTLSLATAGYLTDDGDWYPNLPPAAPLGGWADLDANPIAPFGKAQLSPLPPAPPRGGSGVSEALFPSLRPPTGRADALPILPQPPHGESAVDDTPNPPPRAPSGGKAR